MAAQSLIGNLAVNLIFETAAFEQGAGIAEKRLNKLSRNFEKIGQGWIDLGKKLSVSVTAPIAAAGAAVIKMTGDFEAAMNRVSISTQAGASDMREMSDLALKLGKDTIFGATDAADAMDMLAKNGLSAREILDGATTAAVNLAAAAGSELSPAANAITDVMQQFKLATKDLPNAVNQITGAVNESKLDFVDFALAIGQAGGVAGASGVQFADFNAVLAGTSALFASGSDAGTSFKTFLTRLPGQSKQAAKAIAELGLKFYNADGSLRSMSEIAQELRDKLGGLSDMARQQYLTKIFGTDAMRTAVGLMDLGAAGLDKIKGKIAETDAAAQSAKRLEGFNGQLEELKGSVETLAIRIGQSGLLEVITRLVTAAADLIDKWSEASPATLRFATVVAALTATIGPLMIGFGMVVKALAPLLAAFQMIAGAGGVVSAGSAFAALGATLGPLLPIIAAVAAAGVLTGAMIGCRVNTPRVSIATVPADKLLDGLSLSTTRSRRDRFNSVIPRYRSEDHDWEVISGSPVTVPLYVEQDKGLRTKEIDFPLVQHERDTDGNAQAGQLAAYEIVNSREAGPIRFTVGPEYIGVKTGDVVTLDVPEEGLAAQPVLIRSRSIDPTSFTITFEAETETTAKHDFALGRTTVPPPTYEPTPPDLTPPVPDADLWSLTAEVPGEITPSIAISGVCEFPGADSVLMEYRKSADTDWLTLGKAEASAPVNHVVSALEGETDYVARVAYQSGNRVSDWLDLGPVTTGVNLMDGVAAALEDITDELANYSTDNDNNGLTPPAVTGVTITGTQFPDSTGQVRVNWNSTTSTDPGAANNYDGYLVFLMARTSSAGYTYNPADHNQMRMLIIDRPDIKQANFNGCPVNYYNTAIVIPYRRVRTSVNASGTIFGVPAQSSSTSPFQLADAPNFTGTIAGLEAPTVVLGTNRAIGSINPDGSIVTDKVTADSIIADAINDTDYAVESATIALPGGNWIDGIMIDGVEVDTTERLVCRFVPSWYIEKSGPVQGDTYSMGFQIVIFADTEPVPYYYSPMYTWEERWDSPTSGSVKTFEKRQGVVEHYFTGIPHGTYDVGYRITTGANNYGILIPQRYLNARVPKADE